LHQEAQDAIAANDIARARSAYERALAQNPGDDEARVGVVRVALLERGAQLTDLAAVRQAAGDRPDDVDAQLAVADLDVIGGHVTDAFARLVDVARRTSGPERERVRQRLVELFEVVGTADPRVVAARRSLASALY
jgi:putative thioredoxin